LHFVGSQTHGQWTFFFLLCHISNEDEHKQSYFALLWKKLLWFWWSTYTMSSVASEGWYKMIYFSFRLSVPAKSRGFWFTWTPIVLDFWWGLLLL
jgi:hypothetical protein